jgi:two-component system response regulator (stage 0 sporulation protein F)
VKPRCILVVDDDEGIRTMLADLFREEGYDVTTAVDGRQALEYVRRDNFDVVLLDMAMPVMDGWQLARVLDDSAIHVPLVAMTAARSSTVLAKEVRAAAYLTKPFDIDTVLSTVDQVVQTSAEKRG